MRKYRCWVDKEDGSTHIEVSLTEERFKVVKERDRYDVYSEEMFGPLSTPDKKGFSWVKRGSYRATGPKPAFERYYDFLQTVDDTEI